MALSVADAGWVTKGMAQKLSANIKFTAGELKYLRTDCWVCRHRHSDYAEGGMTIKLMAIASEGKINTLSE